MYKSATKINSVLLKRLYKQQAPYPYRLQKTEPKGSPLFNGAHPRSHVKHSGKLSPLNANHISLHLQRKWILRSSKLSQNQVHGATFVGPTRMFSGKSDEKKSSKSDEKKNSKSDEKKTREQKKATCPVLGQLKNEEKTGCALQKPNTRSVIEMNGEPKNCKREVSQSHSPATVDDGKGHQNFDNFHLDQEKVGKEKLAIYRPNRKRLEKENISADGASTKKIGDFDRLQILKGKLIRKLAKNWLPWEKITDTFENFPYYISQSTKDLLLDCVAARLKKHKLSKFGASLPSSSHLILLQGQPGTEMYQEVLVRAIAHQLQASLLVVDSNTLSAKDLEDEVHITEASTGVHEDVDDNDEKGEKTRIQHMKATMNMEIMDSGSLDGLNQIFSRPLKVPKRKSSIPWEVLRFVKEENKKVTSKLVKLDTKRLNEGMKKLRRDMKEFNGLSKPEIKCLAEETKNLELDNKSLTDHIKHVVTGREDALRKLGKQGDELKKYWHDLIIGDHVRYKGAKASKAKARSKVSIGQEGFVSSVSDSLPWKVCVKFQGRLKVGDADEVFCDAAELEKVDLGSSASDEAQLVRFPELPIEALCKIVLYRGPVVVHFPDMEEWLSSASPSNGRGPLLKRVTELLNKVDGPVVFLASRIKEVSSMPVLPRMDFFYPMQALIDTVEILRKSANETDDDDLGEFRMFKNVIKVLPPEEPQLLRTWQKQLEEDKSKAKKAKNLMLLRETLEHNSMSCADVAEIDTLDMQLRPETAADVIGWARNMTVHKNQIRTSYGKLSIQKESLEKALVRLKTFKAAHEEKLSHIAEMVENEYEKSFLSSVVLAREIGIQFDEIGALENVKSTLQDLIVLPLQRPELFKKGNLRKTCKGVLLFGPPGTGKTLVAKAVATEAGANFINVTASSITSKWYGDDEKLIKGLFSLARKLSPVVIFIDEVDSLLGARGGSSEHEATRRIKNEFMAAWDGLQSKESERILVFATTNRPFDLDDAVIRRLPRRLLVDLPNAENRAKILRIILASEDLDDTFSFETLASQTEGYSGSDLKNLCVAAAYTPIREFLEAEQQAKASLITSHTVPQENSIVRPLCLDDFLQAKAKVGASLAYDGSSMIQLRQWNEQYGEGGSRRHKLFGFS